MYMSETSLYGGYYSSLSVFREPAGSIGLIVIPVYFHESKEDWRGKHVDNIDTDENVGDGSICNG